MSTGSPTAIATVGSTLVDRLYVALSENTDLKRSDVVLGSPATSGNPRLTLFLYQVSENGHHSGEHPESTAPTDETPLVVDCHYLLTAHPAQSNQSSAGTTTTSVTHEQHALLERAMVVLQDNAILGEADLGVATDGRAVQIAIDGRSTTELTNLWATFEDTPFRPSTSYVVGPIALDTDRETASGRVTERQVGGPR